MGDYQDKVAVITGGGGGIGYGIAQACAKEGMKIVLSDIWQPRLEKNAARLAQETGAEVFSVVMDVTREEDMKDLAQKTLNKFGRVDLLFNNAGIHFHKAFDLLTDKDWEWMLRSNVWSVVYGLRTFIPIMEKQGTPCTIVNIGSGASVVPGVPTMVHYSAAKHAVKAITEGVVNELKQRKSNVNLMVVMPDFVVSNLMNSAAEIRPPQFQNEKEEQAPLDIAYEQLFVAAVSVGSPELASISAEDAGKTIMDCLKKGKNYCYTHTGTAGSMEAGVKVMNGEGVITPLAFA